MDEKRIKVSIGSSSQEIKRRRQLLELLKNWKIPDDELFFNLGLFLTRQTLSRILFVHELYQQILNVTGIIIEFGVRWGQNLALFSSLRGIYEPYNYTRKIVGFDTFSGYPSVHDKDGSEDAVSTGAYSVSTGYETYLKKILDYHEKDSPISHIRKYDLIKGDATKTVEDYLKTYPETIIALAYFDFDLYEPTKACLELISDHLTKGSVVGFDELNNRTFPGETLALKETLGLDRHKIVRVPYEPSASYIVIE
jgi:hypothetical protein